MSGKFYKDLIVWQKAMELAVAVFQLADMFLPQRQYELVSQMRKAAISIPSNIAEGSKRGTRKDYRHFICIAYGSGAELETQLELAQRLGLGTKDRFIEANENLDHVMRMLHNLMHRLKEYPPAMDNR